ncbi:hypothetical protein GGX14DRAFT_391937 [Mycena pura]|uniref:Uncharacterized protein n=1 Tax=Mycena pura TaxID=153505 RepID=A0AAD6VL85_9AGAR|nr:hypothetical protein GGX14DRAFT_391937 [Mycena pura]
MGISKKGKSFDLAGTVVLVDPWYPRSSPTHGIYGVELPLSMVSMVAPTTLLVFGGVNKPRQRKLLAWVMDKEEVLMQALAEADEVEVPDDEAIERTSLKGEHCGPNLAHISPQDGCTVSENLRAGKSATAENNGCGLTVQDAHGVDVAQERVAEERVRVPARDAPAVGDRADADGRTVCSVRGRRHGL